MFSFLKAIFFLGQGLFRAALLTAVFFFSFSLYSVSFSQSIGVPVLGTSTPTATETITVTSTPTVCCSVVWTQLPSTLITARGIGIDSAHNIGYVADNNSVSIFNLADGTVTGGVGTGNQFGAPQGMNLGNDGNIYVANFSEGTIEKVNPVNGQVLATLSIPGTMLNPRDVFEDTNGDLYVTTYNDGNGNNGSIYRFVFTAPNIYTPVLLTVGTALNTPTGIVKVGNRLFVANTVTNQILMLQESTPGSNNYNLVTVLPAGTVPDISPQEITTDPAGNVYVADFDNSAFIVYGPDGSYKYSCQNPIYGQPYGIGVDASGNVYLADALNNRLVKVAGGCLAEPTFTPTQTATNTITNTPTNTPTSTVTNTRTNTPTATETNTSTNTHTTTPTRTPTNTATNTRTSTPTRTQTNTPTETFTPTQTNTRTDTQTATPTRTQTNTPTETSTLTPTNTRSNTPTATQTGTPTNSRTFTSTRTQTNTSTETSTFTSTHTRTNTPTATQTGTPTNTHTTTPTRTQTNTFTNTATHTITNTATNTMTFTSTPLPTCGPGQTLVEFQDDYPNSGSFSNYTFHPFGGSSSATAASLGYSIPAGGGQLNEVPPPGVSYVSVNGAQFPTNLSDYTVQADFNLAQHTDSSGLFGIEFLEQPNVTGYIFQWNGNPSNGDGGTPDWEIQKDTGAGGSGFTYIKQGVAAPVYNFGQWVGLKVVVSGNGTVFNAYVNLYDGNGYQLIYSGVTDTTGSPFTSGGVGFRTEGLFGTNQVSIRNYLAYTCVANSPTATSTATNTPTETSTRTQTNTPTNTPNACVPYTGSKLNLQIACDSVGAQEQQFAARIYNYGTTPVVLANMSIVTWLYESGPENMDAFAASAGQTCNAGGTSCGNVFLSNSSTSHGPVPVCTAIAGHFANQSVTFTFGPADTVVIPPNGGYWQSQGSLFQFGRNNPQMDNSNWADDYSHLGSGLTCSDGNFHDSPYYALFSNGQLVQEVTNTGGDIDPNTGEIPCTASVYCVSSPATSTPTNTATHTATNSATNTPTATATRTRTSTATNTATFTETNTRTDSPTSTSTRTATNTRTNTATFTQTNTKTDSPTPTSTRTETNTGTATATRTETFTFTTTKTATATFTATATSGVCCYQLVNSWPFKETANTNINGVEYPMAVDQFGDVFIVNEAATVAPFVEDQVQEFDACGNLKAEWTIPQVANETVIDSLAVNSAGTSIYLGYSELSNPQAVRGVLVYSPAGQILNTFPGILATGIAVDSSTGDFYAAAGNVTAGVVEYTSGGVSIRSVYNKTIVGTTLPTLVDPPFLELDQNGDIIVAGNNTIEKINLTSLTVTASIVGSTSTTPEVIHIEGLGIDSNGNIIDDDTGANSNIFHSNPIYEFDNNLNFKCTFEGTGNADGIFQAMAVTPGGIIFALDFPNNNRIVELAPCGVPALPCETVTATTTSVSTFTSTSTATNSSTSTSTLTPTNTFTVSPSNTPTDTVINTATATQTNTPTFTPLAPQCCPQLAFQWGTQGTGLGQFEFDNADAVDSQGNVYVADFGRIEKFDANGGSASVLLTTTYTGQMEVATFGNLVYVAEGTQIQVFNSTGGAPITTIGTQGSGDGQFNALIGIAVDNLGDIFALDGGNPPRVEKFNSAYTFQKSWSGDGSGNLFINPRAIAVDSNDDVIVTEQVSGANGGLVEKFDVNGNLIIPWNEVAVNNTDEQPVGAATDAANNVYVYDAQQHLTEKFGPNGQFICSFGFPQSLGEVVGVAVGPNGDIYESDAQNQRVVVFNCGTMPTTTPTNRATSTATNTPTNTSTATETNTTTFIATHTSTNSATDTATATETNTATNIATNSPIGTSTPANTVTSTETNTATLSPTNSSTNTQTATATNTATNTSTPTPCGYNLAKTLGGPGTGLGQFETPFDVAVDPSGVIYVADSTGNITVWPSLSSSTASKTIPITLPGGGPYYLAADSQFVYVSNASGFQVFNNPSYTIHDTNTTSTQGLWGIAEDASGNLYRPDNSTGQVFVFSSPSYLQSLFISSIGAAGLGDAVDSLGNIYVSDGIGRVQRFNLSNGGLQSLVTSTGAGPGQTGGAVFDVAVDSCNRVLVDDSSNNRILVFGPNGTPFLTAIPFPAGSGTVFGIGTDNSGNVYAALSGLNEVAVWSPQSCLPCEVSASAAKAVKAQVVLAEATQTITPTATAQPKTATPTPTFTLTVTPTTTPTVSPTSTVSGLLLSAVAAPNISRNGEPIQFMINLGRNASVQLNLYTLMGEEVFTDGIEGGAGLNTITWTLKNKAQASVASGLYLYTLQVNNGYEVTAKTGKVLVFH